MWPEYQWEAGIWSCDQRADERPKKNRMRRGHSQTDTRTSRLFFKVDSQNPKFNLGYLLSGYHHISKKIVWTYYYATISIWSPTNSGVKIDVSLKGFGIWNNNCTPFLAFGSYRPVCIKKAQNFESFLFESILKLKLWNIKSQFSLKLLVFFGHDMKKVPFLSVENMFIINFYEGFHAKFGHED